MTMVAENATGLRNLFKLSSLASFEGQLGKWSRMDAEIIAEHAEGIIATTGCPSGEVQTRLRLGHDREALESAAKWREIFGAGELLPRADGPRTRHRAPGAGGPARGRPQARHPAAGHQRLPLRHPRGRRTTTRRCCASRPARRCRTPTASSSTATATTSSPRPRCAQLWDDEVPGCVRLDAADRRAGAVLRRRVGAEATGCRSSRCPTAMIRRRGCGTRSTPGSRGASRAGVPGAVRRPAGYEIDVICDKGYPVLLPDRRRPGRTTPARSTFGSGPAAARPRVRWSPTRSASPNIDPIKHGLLFERFLNPERASMPDIDIDFDDRRRGEMLRYAAEQVGQRPGRAGHHLRHHQDEGGAEGFGPGALRAARVRHRRPDHQGAAAADHGEGHPAVGHHRPQPRAVQGGRRGPRPASTPIRTCAPSTRPHAVWRA